MSMDFHFKRALAVVPARGGSKRVLRKNLRVLHDRPLVCHTLEAAVGSQCFETVVLSSDDDEILALAETVEGVVPLPRDKKYAGDHATVFSFLHHLVNEPDFAGRYDAIALLLPTAPFRTIKTIQTTAAALHADIDAAITVSPYDFPVQFAVSLSPDEELLEPLLNPSPLTQGKTRSQDQKSYFHPNGAMFLAWWDRYALTGSFYKGRTKGVMMPARESIDLDNEEDFAYAEYVMSMREKNDQ